MSSDLHILNARTRARFQCAFRAFTVPGDEYARGAESARVFIHLKSAHYFRAFQNGPGNQSRTGREPGTGERWRVRP